MAEIAEAFYDIADARVRLSDPVLLSVVGHATIYELADKEVGLSGKQVDDLSAEEAAPSSLPLLRCRVTVARSAAAKSWVTMAVP